MKNTKLKLISLFLAVVLLFTLTACSNFYSSKSFSYHVDTGDDVTVSLDTTGGYDLTATLPFEILRDGKTLMQGKFIKAWGYQEYVNAANSDENARVLSSGRRNGNEYLFWSYDGTEYNYVISIGDSNTAVLLCSTVSEQAAKACFDRLNFSIGG